MAILDRLMGRHAAQVATARWYDLESAGYFEIAGVVHHKDALRSIFGRRHVERTVISQSPIGDTGMTLQISSGTTGQEIVETLAELRRDPRNRQDTNAVEVRIQDRLVGYIPRQYARDWSRFLAACEVEGYGVRAHARVWVGDDHYYVNLHAHKSANYLTPIAEAAEIRALAVRAKQAEADRLRVQAERERERADRLFERIAARESREADKAAAATWKAAGRCARCGGEIEAHQGRGRPSIYCGACLARVRAR